MIEIAICEDDIDILNKIEKELNNLLMDKNIDYKIDKFLNAGELVDSTSKKKYNIFLLDIEIGADDGVELAREIRNKDRDIILIFITNKNDRVYEVFELDTFGFVRKSNFESDFRRVIERLFSCIDEHINKYIINTEKGDIIICIKEISNIERLGGCIYIKTDSESYKCKYRYTTELPFELSDDVFYEIYRGLFVNYSHVSHIKNESVIMNNGDEFPISRRKKKGFKELFKKYMIK